MFTLAEHRLLADSLIRFGIRQILARRLREQQAGGVEAQPGRQRTLIAAMRTNPIALHVGGLHYRRTREAWLGDLDRARAAVLPILGRSHSKQKAALYLQRWRLFRMACSELFADGRGNEWYVAHYRLAPR